ncbi:ABC transporter ATP-binding protein [Anaerococcus hydrogenalis]|uniref:ABC transporter n=1 Tax=Anaerococcus hydrogenalis TaxID=33029 RepID=A0A2N6UHT0_9FIRM|nr:ABC transporter ATP-binding protein [Anaerococcus hydrogenalis]MDK7695432.1 ABC transporter ATP-binding protein [Anaerococcus hydrogenalis]MDK7697191.1 ABC transporter ATP-binding protein [Anaerococcus hydrogenalis]MDK7708288.1 ABC transporter ATP-binding protein [Anaerococcus hydrogenalis]PMC81115.1 ABC transporter [Anaerococcus hydrogenalis]
MNDILKIKSLSKSLNDFYLGTIDLSIKRGSILGYIGENGAGKSTTIKMILGDMKKDSGQIYIFGKKIEDLTEDEKKKIAFVFEDFFFPQEMNVKEVEKFHSMYYGNYWEKEKFNKLVKRFNLPEKKKISTFSRGMKMKLSLILALSHKAELLILDEATSGLDPVARDDILDILLEFIQDENNSIMISSHILSDLEKIADEIAFIHRGKLIFVESKDILEEEYGIVSLSKEEFESLDKSAIISVRDYKFGKECLVKKQLLPKSLEVENASVEEIMVYMIKEKYNESLDI